MKGNLLTIIILSAVLAGAAYFAWQAQNPGETATNSEAARALSGGDDDAEGTATQFTDLDGNPIDLEQFAGQVRVVNSWASWCPFCVEELKDFETLAAELGEDEGVMIAINRGESSAKARAFLKQLGDFEHIIFVKNESDSFYESIGGFSMPETVYYRADGSVAVHKRGFMTLAEMRTNLETTLSQSE